MNTFKLLICATLLAASGIALTDLPLNAYRGPDGAWTASSEDNLRQLIDRAKDEDIRIWVGFTVEVQPDPNLLTPEQESRQMRDTQEAFDEVIGPLILKGDAIRDDSSLVQPPGCIITVTRKGLKRIARSEQVGHITEFP